MDGKVAVITGAAAGLRDDLMGFGGASAWLFAREGARVVLSDVNEELGAATAAQMREADHDILFVKLDVTSERDWEQAIETTVSRFGRLDVLVNNAGTGSPGSVEETTEHGWDEQMAIHAKGVFLGTRAAIPEMRKVGGGSIVNISSIYGLIGSPTATAYHATKGAIRIFSKAAAIQYAAECIRVNSVHPGFALTPMTHANLSDPDRSASFLSRVPAGRFGTADEIARGILYLASDESSYVTWSELVIDGGVTAQ